MLLLNCRLHESREMQICIKSLIQKKFSSLISSHVGWLVEFHLQTVNNYLQWGSEYLRITMRKTSIPVSDSVLWKNVVAYITLFLILRSFRPSNEKKAQVQNSHSVFSSTGSKFHFHFEGSFWIFLGPRAMQQSSPPDNGTILVMGSSWTWIFYTTSTTLYRFIPLMLPWKRRVSACVAVMLPWHSEKQEKHVTFISCTSNCHDFTLVSLPRLPSRVVQYPSITRCEGATFGFIKMRRKKNNDSRKELLWSHHLCAFWLFPKDPCQGFMLCLTMVGETTATRPRSIFTATRCFRRSHKHVANPPGPLWPTILKITNCKAFISNPWHWLLVPQHGRVTSFCLCANSSAWRAASQVHSRKPGKGDIWWLLTHITARVATKILNLSETPKIDYPAYTSYPWHSCTTSPTPPKAFPGLAFMASNCAFHSAAWLQNGEPFNNFDRPSWQDVWKHRPRRELVHVLRHTFVEQWKPETFSHLFLRLVALVDISEYPHIVCQSVLLECRNHKTTSSTPPCTCSSFTLVHGSKVGVPTLYSSFRLWLSCCWILVLWASD